MDSMEKPVDGDQDKNEFQNVKRTSSIKRVSFRSKLFKDKSKKAQSQVILSKE